ncbi:MAG: hypothetical protein HY520_00260 [Candidatus Aenigmarchaeota archaeon]|nr:hypothetical protein [Candidatus Aenigmarchaeota archaeon]
MALAPVADLYSQEGLWEEGRDKEADSLPGPDNHRERRQRDRERLPRGDNPQEGLHRMRGEGKEEP